MDSEKFEREILKLAFETDIRITVATVAYYFGIPSRDARSKLDELIDAGLLELDSDRDGNLFYKLHQEAGSQAAGKIEALVAPTVGRADSPTSTHNAGPQRPSLNETLSYTQDQPQNLGAGTVTSAAAPSPQPTTQTYTPVGQDSCAEDDSHSSQKSYQPQGYDSYVHQNPTPPHSNSRLGSNPKPSWQAPQYRRATSSVKAYRPDATANRCGTSSYVVAEDASCDGFNPNNHYQNQGVSCDDPDPYVDPRSRQNTVRVGQYPTSNDYSPYHGALTPYEPSQQELVEQDRLHHPAVAVILSICLPGAGQFYNGQIEKGVFMMLMTFLSWMAFFGWVFQLWSIFDALVVASRIRSAQDIERNHQAQLEDQRRAIPHRPY